MEYDRARYTVWDRKHWGLLFWRYNPFNWLNEIALGQRMPAVTLIDKTSDAPLMERSYVPCPTCGEKHDARLWGQKRAFGNWYGMVCPGCEAKIPLILNIFTQAILFVTRPLWRPFERRNGAAALHRQAERLRAVDPSETLKAGPRLWVKMGLFFGGVMGVFYSIQSAMAGAPWSVALPLGLTTGALAGLFFGGVMGLFLGRRAKNA